MGTSSTNLKHLKNLSTELVGYSETPLSPITPISCPLTMELTDTQPHEKGTFYGTLVSIISFHSTDIICQATSGSNATHAACEARRERFPPSLKLERVCTSWRGGTTHTWHFLILLMIFDWLGWWWWGGVITMCESAREQVFQYRGTNPSTNPDTLVLITIITQHFCASTFHLKHENGTRSEIRFACYSHCYVMWWYITKEIIASQCPSSRDYVLLIHNCTHLMPACLFAVKAILSQSNLFTMKPWEVMLLILTLVGD